MEQPVTPDECRAEALKCYRASQTAHDREIGKQLLDLVVQWRELAIRIERAEAG